ncbi:MAG: phosphatidylserine decarboxylase [Gammaproteobacteria bacterium]|nr:MAG: phosphatidylserine decarboxylase [Gammaproteobacteria bacterium]
MAAQRNQSLIAREGLPYCALALIISLAFFFTVGPLWSIPFWLVLAMFCYLFRDPVRDIPADPLAVVCPADGIVSGIENAHDYFLDRQAIRICINMNKTGAYTTRSPVEGKVIDRWFPTVETSGQHDIPHHGKCTDIRFAQWVKTDEDDDVILCMSGGSSIIRPSCYVQSGERIGQGHRCGFIPFGATINVVVPENTRIEVTAGQKVAAGSDVIAHFIHD